MSELLLPPELEQQANIGAGVMDRIRNKGAALIAAGAAIVAVLASPTFEEQPAYADTAAQAVVGMPFTGKWGFNAIVNPPYTDSNSSHPSAHNAYGFNWATDLYAAVDTEVKVFGSSPQGTVTFQRNSTSDTCSSYGANIAGKGVTFDVLVNGTEVGEVKYDHLDLTDVGSNPIASGTKIGEVTSEPTHSSCYQTSHTHVQFKNTAGNYSCYADHGRPGEFNIGVGDSLGVLGSANTGAKQACGSPPSGGGGGAADKIHELGFVRTNHGSGQTEFVTWHGAPTYHALHTPALTGYPAISDPEHVAPLAIDTNGDGIDELAFVRTNHVSGQTQISVWHGAPSYHALLVEGATGYPAISDPENVTPIAIDVTGDKIDELGFVRSNHASGKTELVLYHGAPTYHAFHSAVLTQYPAINDPENVTPLAIDLNNDNTDELGFVRTNHAAGKTELVAYHGAPTYHALYNAALTGYPAVSDPENVTPLAIDVTGDGIDELGFVRTNHVSGQSEIVVWNGAPNYLALETSTPTGYPAISDPANVTPVAVHLP